VPTRATSIRLTYDTSDGKNDLSGLGLRIHFYSGDFDLFMVQASDPLLEGLFEINNTWTADELNLDGDFRTNRYITIEWIGGTAGWPLATLPTELFTLMMATHGALTEGDQVAINFSPSALEPGYGLDAPRLEYTLQMAGMLDVDGNQKVKALSDGLIILRYLFGFEAGYEDAIAPDSPMLGRSADLLERLDRRNEHFDIDGDGESKALTDGLLILRYLFGFRGEALISNAVALNATRADAASVETYLEELTRP